MTATGTFETSTDVSYSAAFGGQCGHQPAIAEQSRFMSTRPNYQPLLIAEHRAKSKTEVPKRGP